MPDATFQKEYIVATEFPQQNLGIGDFLFTCIVVPTPQYGNEIPTSLCRNFIPKSLSGNEIPTIWLGNEIPTNRLWELYTIYNPATWSTPMTSSAMDKSMILSKRSTSKGS